MLDSNCAQRNIHLSGFEIGGLIARKCTFKKENHVYEAKENIKYSKNIRSVKAFTISGYICNKEWKKYLINLLFILFEKYLKF